MNAVLNGVTTPTKRTVLTCALLAVLPLMAAPAVAKPMWEVADVWTCELVARAEMDLPNQQVDFLEPSRSYTLDFNANTRTSSFVDIKGAIVDKNYTAGIYGDHNVLYISWDGEMYPEVFIQNGNVFSTTTVSGENGRSDDLTFVHARCLPTLLTN